MRVVAGTARGLRLQSPSGAATRPTTDRVREAVFNSLHSASAVLGARVLDLFAGSGAMGIEALSRGAAHATFVDSSPEAVAVIDVNLAHVGLADRSTVVQQGAVPFLESILEADEQAVDLVIADPPYAFDGWDLLLPVVVAPFLVVESDRHLDLGPRWDVFKEATYAATVVALARAARAS